MLYIALRLMVAGLFNILTANANKVVWKNKGVKGIIISQDNTFFVNTLGGIYD